MKRVSLLALAALAGCATPYQSENFFGGFGRYMTAPDEAVVTFAAFLSQSLRQHLGIKQAQP
jgi:hypothetical protein